MNHRSSFALLFLVFVGLPGCQQRYEDQQAMVDVDLSKLSPPPSMMQADTMLTSSAAPNAELMPPSVAGESPAPANRQFIRSASLKFSVPRVDVATEQIERIATAQGGFVIATRMNSQIDDRQTVSVSADSLLETTRYTVSNGITLRIPNDHLDTTLYALAQLADFVDYRAINADDVTLQRLAAEQLRRRNVAHDQRLRNAIARQGGRLHETTTAEENRLRHQQQTDETVINDLSLADQIRFSTLSLTIYQRQAIRRVTLPNVNDVREYDPGFGTKAADALSRGGRLLIDFLLLLLESWGLILFGLLAYVGVKFVISRVRRQPQQVINK